ncbi:MAG: CTP:Inositol-1-phosphate cytidylyltransferase [Candidatus Saccharicenans subterraneus]|uniref:CTP:Inositol-1-phosphate cytidylyltransferase n=1 Tax=Candidatus Saccharicenans subterraneus TaxID=2508984 RepID=A0A3E2BM69_9BACT|nr:MAG: CTP:Inositol-1-phosphate cytidylyltransferase [Candidatus Saccharicenans subterraneum]
MTGRKAVIILNQDGQKKMLGLSLRQRLILNASQAGWSEFWLFHPDRAEAQKAVFELSSDRRVLDRNIRFKVLSHDLFGSELLAPAGDNYLLFLEDNLVLDPAIFPRLADSLDGLDRPLVRVEVQGKEGPRQPCPGLLVVRSGARADLVLRQVLAGKALGQIEVGNDKDEASVILLSGFAVVVKDRKSFTRARNLLLQTARKPQDGVVSRLINRRISLFLTKYFLHLNIHPIAQSIVTLAVGLLSVFFVGYGRQLLVPGGILFELASIIDGCDGENARLTYRMTRTGQALDITADAVTFVSFFVALPVGLYRTYGEKIWLYLGAFALASMVTFYLQLINYARKTGLGYNIVAVVKEVEASRNLPQFQTAIDRLAASLAFIYRRDFFSTAAFILIVAGLARPAMVLAAVMAFLEALYFYFYSRRKMNPEPQRKGELQ